MEELMKTDRPDWQSVMQYVSQIYKYFETWPAGSGGRGAGERRSGGTAALFCHRLPALHSPSRQDRPLPPRPSSSSRSLFDTRDVVRRILWEISNGRGAAVFSFLNGTPQSVLRPNIHLRLQSGKHIAILNMCQIFCQNTTYTRLSMHG